MLDPDARLTDPLHDQDVSDLGIPLKIQNPVSVHPQNPRERRPGQNGHEGSSVRPPSDRLTSTQRFFVTSFRNSAIGSPCPPARVVHPSERCDHPKGYTESPGKETGS